MRYLILTYYKRADGRIDEAMAVSKNLKNRDLQTANVILDFQTLKVVKASMGGQQVPKNFDSIVQYYMQHYENIITRLFTENGYQVTVEKNEKESTQSPESNPS